MRDILYLGSVFLERKAFLSLARDDILTCGLELHLRGQVGGPCIACRVILMVNFGYDLVVQNICYFVLPSPKLARPFLVPFACPRDLLWQIECGQSDSCLSK